MRMGGGRAEIRGGAGLHSTQPGAEGTKEMLLKSEKDSQSRLSGTGTGLAALQPRVLSQFGDFFQL